MNKKNIVVRLFTPQEVTVPKLYESVVSMSDHEIKVALDFTHLVINLMSEFNGKDKLTIDELFHQMDASLFHEICRRDVGVCNCPSQI